MSRPKRSCCIVTCGWLDADDATLGAQALRGERGTAEQSAAAAWDQQHIEHADLLQKLEGGRAGAGHDLRVIVRRNDGEAAIGGELPADRLAVVAFAIVEHDLAAVA